MILLTDGDVSLARVLPVSVPVPEALNNTGGVFFYSECSLWLWLVYSLVRVLNLHEVDIYNTGMRTFLMPMDLAIISFLIWFCPVL